MIYIMYSMIHYDSSRLVNKIHIKLVSIGSQKLRIFGLK